MSTKLYNITYLKETRKYLRKNMTSAELVLWEILKDKKLCGRKFRRQHSIGYYIADFYCSSEKLIIELDGQHHFTEEGKEKDAERDTHLALMDKKVLRFENKEVLNNLTEVLIQIKAQFKKQSIPVIAPFQGVGVKKQTTMKKIYSIIMLAFIGLSANAQWSTNHAINNAICTAAVDQYNPKIISDGSGGAIITWMDYRSGNYDIYAQRINAAGVVILFAHYFSIDV